MVAPDTSKVASHTHAMNSTLITVLVVLAIVALILFIVRGRGL